MRAQRIHETERQAWAHQVLEFVAPRLAALGIEMPGHREVRVTAEAPLRAESLGECESSRYGTNRISLNPDLDEPEMLVHALIHEYLHACDNCASRHGGRWQRWAALLGMVEDDYDRNAHCQSLVSDALAHAGPPPRYKRAPIPRPRDRSLQPYGY